MNKEINYHVIYINDERKYNRDHIADAIHGNLLPIQSLNAKKDGEIENFKINNPGFKFTWDGFKVGEIGNFASHYLSWKYLLSTELDSILIFEDDSLLYDNFLNKYELAMSNVPQDYDILSLFVHENQMPRFSDSDVINEVISKAYQDWSTLCYVVSRQGAKKLIEYVESIGMDDPTDWFIFRKGHLGIFNVYTMAPSFQRILEIDTRYESQVQ